MLLQIYSQLIFILTWDPFYTKWKTPFWSLNFNKPREKQFKSDIASNMLRIYGQLI